MKHPARFSCKCALCREQCEEGPPGLPTLHEAERLLDAGNAQSLMLYTLYHDAGYVEVLMPAIVGYEGKLAHLVPRGRCVFLNDKRGTCDIYAFRPRGCACFGGANVLQNVAG